MLAPPAAGPSVSLRRYGVAEASDLHDFHQVVLGVDGEMVMAVDGVAERIDGRRAWLIPAGTRHDYAGLGPNRQLVLDLPVASLAVPERWFERARPFALAPALGALVNEFALGLAARAEAAAPAPSARLHWLAATRLCEALLGSPPERGAAAGLDFARIDHWLRARLAEPLRVADLAAHCGFGPRRFHQLFVEAFGETPHRYLLKLRLDAAVLRLADPAHTLAAIAADLGFADQSAFTHAFTRRFGIAPGRWRAGRH
ncbi:AraC family transcriptional regulator [Burkholderia glumae]|uniref:AraC family transcriptional regulator n=3 Tax=Burkholderia glumae TaxID=337 RepID=A0AAP9XV56_BURGL|nr:AraC family transcriptional regulator [Burkholderia glumae]ACR31983.1 AraC-family transcriptional regulator [Burkholderia glumae BGR1]AJY63710.1 helix-turn-helix domain protein [Burkholderia glumae LMG 2196 = ATCC 33617]MCM2484846.1 AraC family transcriptional regulator [Burkholderia glumae]MCM2495227.1 AraC family transcriptional regulator [Burkholderia glumae]MCM2510539.1 AraC family transcriptional regulator [Burkholderia glumae]